MDPQSAERLKSQLRWTKRMEIPNFYDCTLAEVVAIVHECGLSMHQMLISTSRDGGAILVTDMKLPIE